MLPIRKSVLAVTLIATLSLTACAGTQPTVTQAQAEPAPNANDPYEGINRYVFDFNDFIDRLLFAPLAGLYRAMVPPPVRDRVGNIVDNMGEPVTFANNLMQGEMTSAGTTLGRFLLNTTAGVGGMFEVADGQGLYRQHGDFGQTLHVWGAGEGPYIVMPLFGPSNVRDAIGTVVDTLMSPWGYVAEAAGGVSAGDKFMIFDTAGELVVKRERYLDAYQALKDGSLDFYATMRSISRQHRAKELGASNAEMPKFED